MLLVDPAFEVRAQTSASLGPIPLVVLTRGDPDRLSDLTANKTGGAEAAGNAGHDHFAALVGEATKIAVPHGGHFIQLDQPGIVITRRGHLIEKVQRRIGGPEPELPCDQRSPDRSGRDGPKTSGSSRPARHSSRNRRPDYSSGSLDQAMVLR